MIGRENSANTHHAPSLALNLSVEEFYEEVGCAEDPNPGTDGGRVRGSPRITKIETFIVLMAARGPTVVGKSVHFW